MMLFQSVTQAAWNKNLSPPNRNQTYNLPAQVVQKNYHYPADKYLETNIIALSSG